MARKTYNLSIGTAWSNSDPQDARIRALKKEISRKASMANKRVQRLERNDLKGTPAYQNYISGGGQKFSVKGKNYNQLQAELARVNRFINSETSTVRGANRVAKQIASNVGLKFNSVRELQNNLGTFFELASKVEQYLDSMEQMANVIGYQKIWEAINDYVKEQRIDLSNGSQALDGMIEKVSEMLANEQQKQFIDNFW